MSNTKVKDWTCENKSLLFFILATICLLVSTVALAVSNCGSDCKTKKAILEIDTIDTLPEITDIKSSKREESNKDVEKIDTTYYRLPRNVVPKHYKLSLIPNLQKKTFNGSVAITISVLEPTKTVALHSKNLQIYILTLRDRNNESVPIVSKKGTMDKREFLVIDLKDELSQGDYKLIMKYSGRLDKGITGLYASHLKNGRSCL